MKNTILESLPERDRQGVASQMSLVSLKRSTVLFEPGDEPEYVYFPIEAMVSYLSSTAEGQSIEVGLVGKEGVIGIATLFGSVTAFRAVVQVSGAALRVSRPLLMQEFHRREIVRRVFLEYANALLTQIAQTAVCNKFHGIEARFCRWLLMVHDRSGSDQLSITHDAFGRLLGTRRASITIVAGKLQRAGAIRYSRGVITILDRSILKRHVCECYETIVSAYTRSEKAAAAYTPE